MFVGLVLVGARCGGGSEGGGAALSAAVAADLANRSATVARLVEAGEGCAARRQARFLARAVTSGARNGSIPAAVERQVDPVVASLVARIECEPAASAPSTTVVTETMDLTATAEVDSDGDEEAKEKKEKKEKGKHKNNPHDNGRGNDDGDED
jgi:hypothetical protein